MEELLWKMILHFTCNCQNKKKHQIFDLLLADAGSVHKTFYKWDAPSRGHCVPRERTKSVLLTHFTSARLWAQSMGQIKGKLQQVAVDKANNDHVCSEDKCLMRCASMEAVMIYWLSSASFMQTRSPSPLTR
jgi:hypothetical protein